MNLLREPSRLAWLICPLRGMALKPRLRSISAARIVPAHVEQNTIALFPRSSFSTYTRYASCQPPDPNATSGKEEAQRNLVLLGNEEVVLLELLDGLVLGGHLDLDGVVEGGPLQLRHLDPTPSPFDLCRGMWGRVLVCWTFLVMVAEKR